MTDKNLTEIICVLDRSGSMSNQVRDTIGGFNTFLKEQQAAPGEALLTLVLFDHEYNILYSGVNVRDVQPLDDKTYQPRGMTALNDAVGRAILEAGGRFASMPPEKRPGQVIVVITTDGHENASKEFTDAKVREMISHQREKYGWLFLFLAADIQSSIRAQSMGIRYSSNVCGQSVQAVYADFSKSVADSRRYSYAASVPITAADVATASESFAGYDDNEEKEEKSRTEP